MKQHSPLNDVSRITKDKMTSCDTTFAKRRVYCDEFYLVTNTRILYESIDFISLSKRFDWLLLQKRCKSFVKLQLTCHVILVISLFLFPGTPIFKVQSIQCRLAGFVINASLNSQKYLIQAIVLVIKSFVIANTCIVEWGLSIKYY